MGKQERADGITQIDRRLFLKGAAISGAAVATLGVMGCSPQDRPAEVEAEPVEAASSEGNYMLRNEYSFIDESELWGQIEGEAGFVAEPIPEDEIVETVECDVVVAGAGLAGACAAASVVDNGGNVVMLEKMEAGRADGTQIGVFNSKYHKELGIEFDENEIMLEMATLSGYRFRPSLVHTWATRSSEALDWLVERLVNEMGLEEEPIVYYQQYGDNTRLGWGQITFATPVSFVRESNSQGHLPASLATYVEAKGGTVKFKTTAAQLTQDETGRVVGLIAKNEDGTFTRYNTAKGVILATGGYENNSERLKKYLTAGDLSAYQWVSSGKGSTGDGHEMALAAGGWEEDAPHCVISDPCGMRSTDMWNSWALFPFTRFNAMGKRFCNELMPTPCLDGLVSVLPGHCSWIVFDNDVKDHAKTLATPGLPTTEGDPPSPSTDNMSLVCEFLIDMCLPGELESGAAVQADTIAELADLMGVDAAVFEAEIERYNGFAESGVDADFLVPAGKMAPIKNGPFTAVKTGQLNMTTCSGIYVTDNGEVMRPDGSVIPGLYAGGNVIGGLFKNIYPHTVAGMSLGRCMTWGYIEGRHIMTGEA